MSIHIDEPIKCDMCKRTVQGSSTDIWNMTTLYQNTGEVHKIGEQGDNDCDYLVVCDRQQCQTTLKLLWDIFVKGIRRA